MVTPVAQDPQPAPLSTRRAQARLRPLLRLIAFSLLLWAIWTVMSIWVLSPDIIDRALGEPAPFDVQAPREITFESAVETESARKLAESAVADVYTTPDPQVYATQQRTLQQITRYISVLRQDQFLRPDRRVALLVEIPGLALDREQANALGGVNALEETAWEMTQQEAERLLEIGLRQPVRETSLGDSQRSLALLASRSLSPEQTTLAVHLAGRLLAPNSFLDEAATATARQAARDSIAPVQVRIRQGETVIRQGSIITPLAYEKLDQLGYLDRELDWRSFVRAGAQAGVLVILLAVYLARVRSNLLPHPRRQLLLFLVIALLALTVPWVVPGHTLLPYVYPTAGVSMLVALFLGIDLAALVTLVASVLVGLASAGSMELAIYALLGGLTGALVLWKTEQLSRFVRAGLLVILVNLVVIMGFRINDPDLNTRGLAELTGAAALNGALSASLAFIAYSFTGRIFGITTAYQLLELARPNHPLFRQLLIKAPGTYHHAIVVSNMAERAAETIGADALLARVGSYYHDIGKTTRPYYFVENQTDSENPHDKLDPLTSADIITSHTLEGVTLGRRYRLPERVLDFMTEHHGTTLVTYFYRRATQAEDAEVDESRFRYAGPRPRSRETAIVMLADSIEAWTRASRPASAAELERGIRQIISSRLVSGQLDDCDLTLKDLDRIREAFVTVLRGVYHPRIQYPTRDTRANGRGST